VAPPVEFHCTVHVRQRCGLLSSYFDRLLLCDVVRVEQAIGWTEQRTDSASLPVKWSGGVTKLDAKLNESSAAKDWTVTKVSAAYSMTAFHYRPARQAEMEPGQHF